MAASVLNTPRAIEASIFVVRAFVEMRQIALKYTELADKIRQLEGVLETHDEQFRIVFEAITQLLEEDEKPKKARIPVNSPARGWVRSPVLSLMVSVNKRR